MFLVVMAAAFVLAYILGWLPASFVVPVLFICSILGRKRANGPRGLYLPLPGSGTLLASPTPKAATPTPLATRITVATSSSVMPRGGQSSVEAIQRLRATRSNVGALTYCGSSEAGRPGQPPEDAA